MKQLLQYSVRLLFAISAIVLFFACEDGPNFKEYIYPAPTVTGMSASSGYANSYVNIIGKGFDTLKGPIKVYFGGVKADSIISCKDAVVRVKVPAKAVSGKVTFKIWTHTFDSIANFTVLAPPVVISATSNSTLGSKIAAAGDIVTVTGTGFGTDLTKVKVSFNGTFATTISALTDASFKVVAPNGYATGNLIVYINDFPVTGPAFLNPDVKGDVTAFYLQNYKQPFVTTAESGTGRWRNPLGWTVTAPILNHTGSAGTYVGGWCQTDDVIAAESGWGAAAIVNGKIYQTITLPAGTYRFTATLFRNNFKNPVYIAAATGAVLTDAANVPTSSLGYFSMVSTHLDVGAYDTFPSFTFTLTQSTQISIGFVISNMTTSGEFWRVRGVKLESI